MTTYALLVGINEYRPPINALYGCVADVDAFATVLQARVPTGLELRVLRNAEATRETFIAAMRDHLGTAGPDDVALLYYAGHGGEEPAPAALARVEGSSRLQTLVLADCGQRVGTKLIRPIADKELSVLLSEVGTKAGHFAVFLDCCHSGDADRGDIAVRAWEPNPDRVEESYRDIVIELGQARPLEDFLAGVPDGWVVPELRHVRLSACAPTEKAKEQIAEGATRGVFSLALQDSLAVLGPDTSYRTLLETVRSRVQRAAANQRPELAAFGATPLIDAKFLDGTITPAPRSFRMTKTATGFQLDGGQVHGLRPPDGDAAFLVACTAPDGSRAGTARVTAVDVGTSVVEPMGWEPADVAYVAVVVGVPLPPTDVSFDEPPAGVEDFAAQVRDAVTDVIATAGPDEGPSPDLRVVGPGESHAGVLRLRVDVPAPGAVRIRRADGSPVTTDVEIGRRGVADVEAAARLTVTRLVHLSRWERIRGLGDHPSPFIDAVELRLYRSSKEEQDQPRPDDRQPLAAAAGYELRYTRGPDGKWVPPYVYADVVNRSERPLHIAVLDLTDRYRCDPLMQTRVVGAGQTFALDGNRNLSVSLPAGRAVQPGASSRDWLLVIASEVDFSVAGFQLDALDDPPSRDVRRDVEGPPLAQWSAFTVTLDVTVPED